MGAEWFARKLKELRDAAGLSQGQLAEEAGLSQKAISLLEAGNRQPTWDTVCRIADALGAKLDQFREPAATNKRGK
jgi:transcriptional regulator with XRE-family HTH domain